MQTQLTEQQLKNNALTGASFASDLKFFDETANYDANTSVWWQMSEWKSIVNVTGNPEGDLTNAPHLSTNWQIMPVTNINKNTVAYSQNSSAQTFNTTAVPVNFANFVNTSEVIFNTNTITINKSGVYNIRWRLGFAGNTNSRINVRSYVTLNGSTMPNTTVCGFTYDITDGKLTSSWQITKSLVNNDVLRIFVLTNGSTCSLEANASYFEIEYQPNVNI